MSHRIERVVSGGQIGVDRAALDAADYAIRTELNVRDSEATLIIYEGPLEGGTHLTEEMCRRHRRPSILIPIDRISAEVALLKAQVFLQNNKPRVLNVAGPRESSCPGIYLRALGLLRRLLDEKGSNIVQ